MYLHLKKTDKISGFSKIENSISLGGDYYLLRPILFENKQIYFGTVIVKIGSIDYFPENVNFFDICVNQLDNFVLLELINCFQRFVDLYHIKINGTSGKSKNPLKEYLLDKDGSEKILNDILPKIFNEIRNGK